MFHRTIAVLRRAMHSLLAFNSVNQIAAGFALGMVIGLVPKGNFIALSLFVLLFSLRCNKGIAILAVVIFSCASVWTDPLAHRIGLAVLTVQPMQATYASIFSLPFGPWLGYHNTVVTGSLLLGLYTIYPAYWLVRWIALGLQSVLAARPAWSHAPQAGGSQ